MLERQRSGADEVNPFPTLTDASLSFHGPFQLVDAPKYP